MSKEVVRDFYMYISSTDCEKIYVTNSASDFTVVLPQDLSLKKQHFLVGITSMSLYNNTDAITGPVHILANFIDDSYSNGRFCPIIKKLYLNGKQSFSGDFTHVDYKTVTKRILTHLRISLTDNSFETLSLSASSTLSMTLHFKYHD